jgi:cysteine desulfurase
MQPTEHIYLDYAATTPVDKRVLDVMLPFFAQVFGNTSSIHFFGQKAEAALEESRESMAKGLNCQPGEIIFTSCGSESDNLALRGAALAARKQRNANHLLISPVEHHAISRTAQQLADLHGFELEYLHVDDYGRVDPGEVKQRLRPDTALVSVIYANNEIGSVNPISEIGEICRSAGIPFHTDAVQAAAYLPVDVEALKVDMLSLGAHKFYGPKGVGALYVRADTPLLPVLTGGGQESSRRAGTHNTAYIAGMAYAFRLAQEERVARTQTLLPMRDHLIGKVLESIPDSRLTGHPVLRLPNHASFVFNEVDGNALLMLLDVDGFACSSGSACKTGDPEPSDVLIAMGLERSWALGSLRVTLGSGTAPEHIQKFTQILPEIIKRQRQLEGKRN